MGQVSSNECQCRDSLFHLCVPDAQQNDAQKTLEIEVPSAQKGPTHVALLETKLDPNLAVQMTAFTLSADEGAVFAAPPPIECRSPASSLNREQRNATVGSAYMDVTVDDILSNPEGAEGALYGEAFAKFHGGHNEFVGLDSRTMRDFICTNTCISMQDIDVELLKIASSEQGLSLNDFLALLREFSISDSDCITQFVGMSVDGESLVAEECRTALLLFMQQALATNFSDEHWERIFNTVMWDAGVTVLLEQWIPYCKLTARIVRMLRYTQIQKLAKNPPHDSRGQPVRGGA